MELSTWIKAHIRGELDYEVGDAITQVAQAVLVHGKTGSVTLELKLDKVGGKVQVAGRTKVKIPTGTAEASTWYLGEDGLVKEDPLQGRFDLGSEVTPPTVAHDRYPPTAEGEVRPKTSGEGVM